MDDLRDLLHNAAEEMRVPPEIPAKTLRRAKRRRLTNAAITGLAILALVGGGLFVARGLTGQRETQLAQGQGSTSPAPVDAPQLQVLDDPQLQVLNGTSANGLAASVAQALETYGYTIKHTGNASRTYERTTLFYNLDSLAAAQEIATRLFPGAPLEPTDNNLNPEIDVTIVVGENDRDRDWPGPGMGTSSGDPPVEPVKVLLLNGTDRPELLPVYAKRLRAGDFEVLTGNASRTYQHTTVFPGVRGEESAMEIADFYFRGARVEPSSEVTQEGIQVTVVLGEDIPPIASHLGLVDELVARFVEARLAGEGAERFLSSEAMEAFAAGDGGLALYAPEGVVWLRLANRPQSAALPDDTATVPVTIVADSDDDPTCSELYSEELIVSARRTRVRSIKDLVITGAKGPRGSSGITGYCPSQ